MSDMTCELNQSARLTADLRMESRDYIASGGRDDAFFTPRCKLFNRVNIIDNQLVKKKYAMKFKSGHNFTEERAWSGRPAAAARSSATRRA
jgi:hypothetical protein